MQESAILLLNKERGMSSNKAVNKVKFLLGAKKAGHLGTLDVLGEGLLLITLNKATKLFDYFLEKDKEYDTIFKFGQTSPTLDLEGELTKEDHTLDLNEEDVKKILPSFVGKQMQIPPIYSAKKINGQKAYSLAREGKTVDLSPKEIEIFDINLLKKVDKNTFEFKVTCSSGTFIRSLCRDIASKLSTCGVMQRIIRTRCGKFTINNSYTLQDIENGKFSLIGADNVFEQTSISLEKKEFEFVKNGVQLSSLPFRDGKYKVYHDKLFLGLGEVCQGKLKLLIRLF